MFKAAGGPGVDRDTFVQVATKFGLDGEAVVDQFNGEIDSDAFLKSLREPFPPASSALMDKIWNILDGEETGRTDGTMVRERYDERKFSEGCDYIGKYTDPNHEGGFRVISLKDEMDGEKRLATVVGIGGAGEPEHFELPAWINPDNSIVIDFSVPPKGGPKDFVGLWQKDGIQFIKDGNKWPKVEQPREENTAGFFKMFNQVNEIMKEDFYDLYQDIYLSCGQEKVFIHFLEQCFGVKSDDQNPQFLAAVESLFDQLHEKIVVGPLEGNIDDESKALVFFKKYDVNGDGKISGDELETMMKDMGVIYDRSCLNKLMKILDTN